MNYLQDNIVSFYKALAHPTRLKILDVIKEHDEICVCNINDDLDLEQSNLSQHLKVLRNSGILTTRRDGSKIMYSLTNKDIITALNTISDIVTTQLEDQFHSIKKGD